MKREFVQQLVARLQPEIEALVERIAEAVEKTNATARPRTKPVIEVDNEALRHAREVLRRIGVK